jgi:hypothetical protein
VRSSSRTASPEFHGHAESVSSQQSATPLSQSHRNLRSSGQPAEHVDVEHIDVSHLSREARALLEDDLAHTPGSQGSPRLARSSARSASATPSKTSTRATPKTRKGKSSSTRKISDISVTEDEDDHLAQLQSVDLVAEIPSTSQFKERDETDNTEPVLAVQVEEWRSNLNPSNANLADTVRLTDQEGVSVSPTVPHGVSFGIQYSSVMKESLSAIEQISSWS